MVHLWRREPDLAEAELRPGYEALKRVGERSHFSSFTHGLCDASYQLGRYDEAELLSHECEDACRPNDVHSQILWRSIRAKVLARRGELEPALELARAALDLAEGGDFLPAHAGALEDHGKVLYMAGRREESAAALRASIDLYERKRNLLAADRVRALTAG
jgi:tetratricopeptide (TPR) repeat protein